MKLRWTRLALADFEQAHDHIAQDNPEAALQIAQRILDATETLLDYPRIGRVGEDEDSREWRENPRIQDTHDLGRIQDTHDL